MLCAFFLLYILTNCEISCNWIIKILSPSARLILINSVCESCWESNSTTMYGMVMWDKHWTTKQPHLLATVMVFLHVRPQWVNARQNRCQEDLNSFPLGHLEETTGCPHTVWMKIIQQDLKSNTGNLSQNESFDCWRGSESSTLETDVYIWCNALQWHMPEMFDLLVPSF